MELLGSPNCTAHSGTLGAGPQAVVMHTVFCMPWLCVPPAGATRGQAEGQPLTGIGCFGVSSYGCRVRGPPSHTLPRLFGNCNSLLDHGKQLCLRTSEEMHLVVVYTQRFTAVWSLNASKYIGFPAAVSPNSAVPRPREDSLCAFQPTKEITGNPQVLPGNPRSGT